MSESKKPPLRDRVPEARWGSNEYWATVTGTTEGRYSELINYATFRANGYDRLYSFNAAFGYDEDGYSADSLIKCRALETTEEFRRYYDFALGAVIPNKKTVENLAIATLLEVVRSDGVTQTSKIKATETLCTLMGITTVGEDGKVRKVGKMSDFYKDIGTEHLRDGAADSLPSSDAAENAEKVKH